jgi:hypothetical protein
MSRRSNLFCCGSVLWGGLELSCQQLRSCGRMSAGRRGPGREWSQERRRALTVGGSLLRLALCFELRSGRLSDS